MPRVLICGSRDWNNSNSIMKYLETLTKDSVIIHGAVEEQIQLQEVWECKCKFTKPIGKNTVN